VLIKILFGNQKAQTFIEFTIVVGMIIVIIFAMNPLIKRAIQGMVKSTADQIGYQNEGDQGGLYNTVTQGYMEAQYVSTRVSSTKETIEFLGTTNYVFGDTVGFESGTQSNLGFTPELKP